MKAIIKAILPSSKMELLKDLRLRLQAGYVGQIFTYINFLYIKLFSMSGVLSSLFYFAFSRSFDREHRSILAGRRRYLHRVVKGKENVFLLRRNIHRLEKGLIMRPRRPVFAKDYIGETVDCYGCLLPHKNNADEPELKSLRWANDVLTEYFSVVRADEKIREYRKKFESLQDIPTDDGTRKVPYHRDLMHKPVSYEQFKLLALKRRSVRWFKQDPVPRELIDNAIEVASCSPTACNRQPYRFLVYDDSALVAKISGLPAGTPGFKDNIPVIVVLIGDLSAYYSERDRHLIYIDGGLSAMSFCYALEVQGLSSCCINWPDIEAREKAMEQVLNLEPYERPIMLIALGYPDETGMVAFSQKRPLSVIRKYNN